MLSKVLLAILILTAESIAATPSWSVNFSIESLNVSMESVSQFELHISDIPLDLSEEFAFKVLAENTQLLSVNKLITRQDLEHGSNEWRGNVSVGALFMGQTKIYVILEREPELQAERAAESLNVIIVRKTGPWDMAFLVIVGSFVLLIYVNFGAALDLQLLKEIIMRPVGPGIGFVAKFLIMPILGYAIGYYIFHDQVELRLGLFFTAITPAGGSSNVFTALLDGNLNLSVTMTALSNLAAFIMMPIWIFTLGAVIFHDGNFVIPYVNIATSSCSLLLPLAVGILLKKYKPHWVALTVRYLKTVSFWLILSLWIFAAWVNSYMFKLFSPKIILASATLSWSGYLFGYLMGRLFGQSKKDSLTIAIETGIENTAIAIFMLSFTLPQPTADITSAVPVANSAMTPFPLFFVYLMRKWRNRNSKAEAMQDQDKEVVQLSAKELSIPTQQQQQQMKQEVKEIREHARAQTMSA